ncbi:MAG: hypothetical protein ACPG7U_03480 [Holosporaceae bacterium]
MLFVKDALIGVRKTILENPFTQHLPIYFHAPIESDFPYLVLGGQKARAGFNKGCFDLKMTLVSLSNQNFVQEDLWHHIEKTLIQKNGLKVFFKGATHDAPPLEGTLFLRIDHQEERSNTHTKQLMTLLNAFVCWQPQRENA